MLLANKFARNDFCIPKTLNKSGSLFFHQVGVRLAGTHGNKTPNRSVNWAEETIHRRFRAIRRFLVVSMRESSKGNRVWDQLSHA